MELQKRNHLSSFTHLASYIRTILNIALLSPSQNAYSETFIQAHKELLNGRVFYYYSGDLPKQLEGGIVINSRRKRILDIVKGHYRLNTFSLDEQALISSFKKNRIDIVFAEYGPCGQKIIPVCRKLNLPLIVHFHGFDASKHDILEAQGDYQEVFAYAKFVVVVSKKMYNDFIALGCSEGKLIYTVCGPRKEFFEVKPEFSKAQFISIGRFVNKKAPYYLILSFKKVLEKFPKSELIMAGDGELWNTCKNLVKYNNLQNNITFTGVIEPEELRQYLKESTALVQHSITAEDGDSEGTPVSILEACAAGLPIISTKHAGIPEVVEHKVTGLLVEEHDVNGMAENMLKLLQDPVWAKELGKEGRKRVRSLFDLEKHINILDNIIGEAIHKK